LGDITYVSKVIAKVNLRERKKRPPLPLQVSHLSECRNFLGTRVISLKHMVE
jgi:hypothetical protein